MAANNLPPAAVVVFGGSGGIGQCIARSFAEAGTDLALMYRSKQGVAERVAGEIAALGGRATTHAADVTDSAQILVAVDAAEAARRLLCAHGLGPARDGLPVVPKAANEALVKGVAKEEGLTTSAPTRCWPA